MTALRPGANASGAPAHDWTEHLAVDKKQSYDFFISLLRAALLLIAFVLTALVSFGFGHILPVGLGFLILVIGAFAVVIDMARHSHFGLTLSVLAVAALIVAVSAAH